MNIKNLLKSTLVITCCFYALSVKSQSLSTNFEVRYFSKDNNANGETDFKGETSVFTTEERINFLSYYANEVSAYYGDKELNTEVAPDEEVNALMASIKAQPLPLVRKRINLNEWKWLSSRPGQRETSQWEANKYIGANNLLIKEGALMFKETSGWKWDFAVQLHQSNSCIRNGVKLGWHCTNSLAVGDNCQSF